MILKKSKVFYILGGILIISAIAFTYNFKIKTIAQINGDKIRAGELSKITNTIVKDNTSSVTVVDVKNRKDINEKAEEKAAAYISDKKVIDDEIEKLKLSTNNLQAKVNEDLKEIRDSKNKKITDSKFKLYASSDKLSDKELKEHLLFIEKINLLEEYLTKDLKISDADCETYYEDNKYKYLENNDSKLQVKDIITKDEDTIKKVFDEIKGGLSFDAAVKKYSIDMRTKDFGGDMTLRNYKDYPKDIVEHATNLRNGEISEPFKTNDGFMIIQLNHKDTLKILKYEDVKEIVKKDAYEDLKEETISKYYKVIFDKVQFKSGNKNLQDYMNKVYGKDTALN